MAGGAGTAKIYSGGISGLSSKWNFNRRPLVFHGMHCWCAWVQAVLGGGCLSFAGVMLGILSGLMVPGHPVPGEGKSLGRKGIDLSETPSR